VTAADAEPPSRPHAARWLWVVGAVMASATAASLSIYAALAIFRNLLTAYCVAWVFWSLTLFLVSRRFVFGIDTRRRLLTDALVYLLGSALELVVWSVTTDFLNRLEVFDKAPVVRLLVCGFAPTVLHVLFILMFMEMIVFRRVLQAPQSA
jgi:hypothetical protein